MVPTMLNTTLCVNCWDVLYVICIAAKRNPLTGKVYPKFLQHSPPPQFTKHLLQAETVNYLHLNPNFAYPLGMSILIFHLLLIHPYPYLLMCPTSFIL